MRRSCLTFLQMKSRLGRGGFIVCKMVICLKNFFCHCVAFCEERTYKRQNKGNNCHNRRNFNDVHPTAVVRNRAEAVCTENRADITASVKECGNTAHIAVFANAERNEARRNVDDTADHKVHNRKEKHSQSGIFDGIEKHNRNDRCRRNGI